jgi:hypothetical protein
VRGRGDGNGVVGGVGGEGKEAGEDRKEKEEEEEEVREVWLPPRSASMSLSRTNGVPPNRYDRIAFLEHCVISV